MAVTINVNGLSLVHVGSGGIAMASVPDVCLTPSSPSPVPVPYPNIAVSADITGGTSSVLVDGGNSAAILGCKIAKSSGDEAGSVGGVGSGTFTSSASFISFSPDVMMDGKPVCRLSDKLLMNQNNTVCNAGEQQMSVPLLPDYILGPVCDVEQLKAPKECVVEDLTLQCSHSSRGYTHELDKHGRKTFHVIPDSGKVEEVTFSYFDSCGVTLTSGGPECGNLLIVDASTGKLLETITRTNEKLTLKAPSVFDEKPDKKIELPAYYFGALTDLLTYICRPAKIPTKGYDIVSSKCSGAGRTLTRVRVHPAMSWDFEIGLGLSFATETPERSYGPGSANPRLRTQLKDEEKATFYVTLKASDGSEELSLDTEADTSHSSDLSKRLFQGLQKQFTNLSGLLGAIERKYGGVDGKVDIKWPKAVFSGNLSQIELPQEAGVGFEGNVGLAADPLFGASITVDLLDMILEHGGKLFGPWGAAIGKIALFVKRWAAEDSGDSTLGATLDFGFPFTTGGDIKCDAKWAWSDAKAGTADEPGERGASGSLSGRVFVELKGGYKFDARIKGKYFEFKAGKEGWYKSGSVASGESESAIVASIKPAMGKDGRLDMNGKLEFTGLSIYKMGRSEVSAGGNAANNEDRDHLTPFKGTASGKRTDEVERICDVIPVFSWPDADNSNLEALIK